MKGKSSNKTRIMVVTLALVLAIGCLIMADMFLKKNIPERVSASITESKYIENREQLSADSVIQTGTVVVHYVDEDGSTLKPDYVLEGNVGEEYEVKREEISKYTNSGEEPLNRAGRYALKQTEVTFVYKKSVNEVSVQADNQGKDGTNKNKVSVILNNPQSQREYDLRIVTKDENGNVINGANFIVRKDNNILHEGQVINGSFYAGKIGINEVGKKVYEIEETKATLGYGKISDKVNLGVNAHWDDGSKKFVVTLDEITVDGVTATVNQQEKTGEIIVEVVNKKSTAMYGMQIISKSGNTLLSGYKFKVVKENEMIAEGYTDNGILSVGEFEITEEGKETFEIYEEETAEGYGRVIQKETAGIVEITKKYDNENKKYYVVAKCSNIPGFSVDVSEEGMVNVYIEPLGNRYDLAIKKFVSAIDGQVTVGREPDVKIVEVKKENVGTVKEIQYTQNGEMERVANEQEITYTLRTYNESNLPGLGNKILENISDGLVFLPENETNKKYEWKLYIEDENGNLKETNDITKATVIATDYLTDKTIEGFNIETDREPKHLDVEVVFKIDESKITSKDRTIENTVKIVEPKGKTPEGGIEINTDNNVTSEVVYVKYFDLNVKKYIKEVTVKSNSKEKKYEIGENRKSELIKIDIPENEVNNTTLRITYGLKVTNVGEIEGYATELIDYMPADFKLIEDGEWKIDGEKAVTTELDNTLLKPGESTTAEITFEWKLSKDNIGSKLNKGKILKYENPYNATTDPKIDNVEILVQIKTGSTTIFKTLALIAVFILFLIAVVKIKKNNRE